MTAELVRRGELREDDELCHPHHGVLTRALGVAPDVEIDQRTVSLEEGDRIVVCSDGLFNELTSQEIANSLSKGDNVAGVADSLMERAIAHGGHDNVSVVVAEIAS